MNDRAKKYLVDILYSIDLIEAFSGSITSFFDNQKDLKTKSAVERQLGIIGEAVNQFSKEERKIELSQGRKIVDFRNRLIHAYDNLDDAIVWVILHKYIPTLKDQVQELLAAK
jgi:uncharacterized protein with HEPN domain